MGADGLNTEEALVEISKHLMRANDLIGSGDQGGEVGGRITWAQMVLEERFGAHALEPVPSLKDAKRETTVEHLARAAELADDHLGSDELDLRLKRALQEALSPARQ